MKKLICLLLVAVFAFGLAACGEKTAEKDTTPGYIGKWQNKITTPDGDKVTQTYEILEDGTANCHVESVKADGTTETKDTPYTWVLDGSDLKLHGEKYDETLTYVASEDMMKRGGMEFKRVG